MNDQTSPLSSQLQDMWRTRPVRLPAHGKVAGVAAGIGYRYNVDPLLIRIAFVVSAIFGGAGIALYLACWLVFPDNGSKLPDDGFLGKDAAKLTPSRTVLLVLLAVAVLSAAPFGSDVSGAGLLGAVVMLGGLWLLHQRQPEPPADPSGIARPTTSSPSWWHQTAGHDAAAPDVTGSDVTGSDAGPQAPSLAEQLFPPVPQDPAPQDPAGSRSPDQPPSWDPLGAAPFAWDLPDPTPVSAAPEAVKRHVLTPVVLGLALLTAAALTGASLLFGITWLTPSRIAAASLGVIGLGLVIGAFRRTGQGLLIAAAPLAGFIILSSLAGQNINLNGGVGAREYRPASVTELQAEYRVGVGELRLDLRDVVLDRDRTVDAVASIGQVNVTVPHGMNVRVECQTSIGDTKCDIDNPAGDGPVLTINAHNSIGEVVVSRG